VRLPQWTYWEPVEAPVAPGPHAPDPPFTEAQIARTGGLEARWKAAPAALRDQVLRNGIATIDPATPQASRIGAMYEQWKSERVPFVVTIDALAFYTHLALERARAEVEAEQLAPSIDAVLRRLDVRLSAEARDAHADLAPAYLVARGIVAVAMALSNPSYATAADLNDAVTKEKGLVVAHAGTAQSPLLGTAVDYSAMAPRGLAEKEDARLGYFRALAWLGQAPMILAGRGEEGGPSKMSVTLARTHARAALLIARLLDHDVDAEASQAWLRVERLASFLSGPADDVTPAELGRAAVAEKLELKDAQWIANIARVDRVRHLAAQKHVTRLFDGSGGLRVTKDEPLDGGVPRDARATPSVRLFGGRVASDGEAMQRLVFPTIGLMTIKPEHVPATMRDGLRALPSGLDVIAWLGSNDARDALHDSGDDAYAGYDAELDKLRGERPGADAIARHESVYASTIEAVAAIAAPSAADRAHPPAASAAWRRRKIEAALVAWTELRHGSITFTRLALAKSATAEPARTAAATGPAFVEPNPEAIAALLGAVRQTMRGLLAMNALTDDSPARAILREVDDLLWTALGVALRQANDEPLTQKESETLAAFPARFADIEARVALSGAADTPIAIDVHTDLAPARALEEAVGYADELYMVMLEPRTRKLVLAIGASLPHYEFAQPSALRLSDGAWRARLAAGSPPPRDAFAKAYAVERAPAAESGSALK
jgi:hypothetical protein